MNSPPAAPAHGAIWQRFDDIERRLSAPLTRCMLDRAHLKPGMKVLDLASGRGEPAIGAALRVQPDGQVLGLDIDRSVLAIARTRAMHEQIRNLLLIEADAETLETVPGGSFDCALCRWGLMYFKNPVDALRSVRRSLVDGGTLVAAVWTAPERASFHNLPRLALSSWVDIPPATSSLPGPFYYANEDRLLKDIERAGFSIETSDLMHVDVMQATSDAQLIDWCRSIGVPRLLQTASPDIQQAWEQTLVRLSVPYRREDGSIRLGGTTAVISASAR